MRRFLRWKVRNQLAATFLAVLLPLLAAEVVAVEWLRTSLRASAERELTNVVDQLYRLCELQRAISPGGGPAGGGDAELLRAAFLNTRVGASGYAYCMDDSGRLIIHPAKEGQDISDSRDAAGFPFVRAICAEALRLHPGEAGTIRYPWRNPEIGEERDRTKILKFRYYAPWRWIIAAGSYEEEVYEDVARLGWYTAPLLAMSVLLLGTLTLVMNRLITRPLHRVSEAASRMAGGDSSAEADIGESGQEFSALAYSFNTMAAEIRGQKEELERLVEERTEALRESGERYRSLVQSTVDGIATADPKGTITFINRGLEEMLGYSKEETLGRRVWDFYPAGLDEARKIMALLREQGNLINYEMELIGKKGVVPVRTSASILRDRDGREQGTLAIFSDITAQKTLEADLRRAQAHLIQTMKLRALGDLVSGVAHEINNPLMASTTLLHVMDASACPAECPSRNRLHLLRRCNERIARIVDHLREFSRQTELRRELIDVNGPLESALLLSGQQLMNLQIAVERELASGLAPVLGDAGRLEQVFLDIIANARDAMERQENHKVLTIRTMPAALEGAPAVAAEISDTGPGIPADALGKIFEPFFTTKEAGKGTGLGLAIAHGILAEHGGDIDVPRTGPKGTTFRIVLPCAPAQ
ncbi:MAG: PAS domain S-box protein [Deltaproteobacteria bacterium]|nr:PAS domain S-box protein [Deltaproteobacteria bacterium]